MSGRERMVCVTLAVCVALFVGWVRLLPLSLSTVDALNRAQLRYPGADGRAHTYLGDYDSYLWLRHARRYLQAGTTCDAISQGVCRDTYGNAPVGRPSLYHRSLHIVAIVALHRMVTFFRPGYPLPASAFLVPVIVGALGAVPAFAIGWRLAGSLGGVAAALLVSLNPLFLARSIGSDNDVWNVVLPLAMVAAAVAAEAAARWPRRLTYAVLAGACVGLHAGTWSGWEFGYDVLLVGWSGYVLTLAVGAGIGRWRAHVWKLAGLRDSALTLAVFVVAAGFATAVTGSPATPRSVARLLSGATVAQNTRAPAVTTAAAGEPAPDWPDALRTVSELARPDLAAIAGLMESRLFFFAGWLGLLVIVLPRRAWQWWHFVVLIAGNYLYRYLIGGPTLSHAALLMLLAAPLATALALSVVMAGDEPAADRAAALIVIAWFLGALLLAYGGLRFVMLLVPPFGIACGAALGRLYHWLTRLVVPLVPEFAGAARAVLALLVGALLIAPVQRGCVAAQSYLPRMNDAWWDALTRIRDEAPHDAIVSTWWDYGYWVEYAAERPATADGGSLRTHIPHWIGRALIAPSERESVGLLRMLDCGSDANAEPERSAGAFGKLAAHGLDAVTAHSVIVRAAGLERDAARALLAHYGVTGAAQDDVLQATHCRPPPAYLVLSSRLAAIDAWRYLGNWDLGRSYVVKLARTTPEAEAIADLVGRHGYAEPEARDLYRRATALHTRAEEQEFIGSRLGLLAPTWWPCHAATTTESECPVGRAIDAAGTLLDAIVFPSRSPQAARLRLSGKRQAEGDPAALRLADGAIFTDIVPLHPVDATVAVLLDIPNQRALVGSPAMVRSTYTHLMFLDGRYAEYFEKFDERTGFAGERVVTWKVNWEGTRAAPGSPGRP